jgi:pyruvate/2-oxoglutarate dehydrogenase complex dihydrolipoamide acyltransferase (E2) component
MRVGHKWPAGDYEAQEIVGASCRSCGSGNVALDVKFSVKGDQETYEVEVPFYLFKKGSDDQGNQCLVDNDISLSQLSRLKFDGNFDNPGFKSSGPYVLTLKHGTWNNKPSVDWGLARSSAPPADKAKLGAWSHRFKVVAGRDSGPPPVPAKPATPPAPPAAPAPAKAPAPPAKKASTPRTRDAAWAHFVTVYAGDAAEKWNSTIAQAEGELGRAEDTFTEADYGRVYEAASSDIPF